MIQKPYYKLFLKDLSNLFIRIALHRTFSRRIAKRNA